MAYKKDPCDPLYLYITLPLDKREEMLKSLEADET